MTIRLKIKGNFLIRVNTEIEAFGVFDKESKTYNVYRFELKGDNIKYLDETMIPSKTLISGTVINCNIIYEDNSAHKGNGAFFTYIALGNEQIETVE